VNKGITICSTPREVIHNLNQLCKQAALKKSLTLHTHIMQTKEQQNTVVCHSEQYTSEERVTREMKEALCTPQEEDSKSYGI